MLVAADAEAIHHPREHEGQEAQQHHGQRAVLVAHQAELAAAVQHHAVEQLRLVRTQHRRQRAPGVRAAGHHRLGRVRHHHPAPGAAAYGVWLLESREIWAPRAIDAQCAGLAAPPPDAAGFARLADAVVSSARIAAMLA